MDEETRACLTNLQKSVEVVRSQMAIYYAFVEAILETHPDKTKLHEAAERASMEALQILNKEPIHKEAKLGALGIRNTLLDKLVSYH